VIAKVKRYVRNVDPQFVVPRKRKHKHNLNMIFNKALKTQEVLGHHGLIVDML
jgi:hypothetical protein